MPLFGACFYLLCLNRASLEMLLDELIDLGGGVIYKEFTIKKGEGIKGNSY